MTAQAAGLREFAPAKVNLTLHVLGRRPDGYHELDSLVAFADVGDDVSLEPDPELSLVTAGETAGAAGPVGDNLMLTAARALSLRMPQLTTGRFTLAKRLPVAAGLGGGSSDAAAALRLIARANGVAPDHPDVFAAAAETGSDVPVCLDPRARRMSGRGEIVGPPVGLAAGPALLVHPGLACPTAAVFAALGLAPGDPATTGHAPPGRAPDWRAVHEGRNDLEAPALRVAPVIADVLAALRRTDGCLLARMSGSGATCFALYADRRGRDRAREAVSRAHPGWWCAATMLA